MLGRGTPKQDGLIKYMKHPELFQEYAQMRNEENEKYQEHMKKMRTIMDSRRNMRVDMRPKVVARTMTKELLLVFVALSACVIFPLYFLKLRHIKAEYTEKYQEKLKLKS